MNTEEKLLAIHRWSYEFEPFQNPNGKWHGHITYSSDSMQLGVATPLRDFDEMIDYAYALVYEHIREFVLEMYQ